MAHILGLDLGTNSIGWALIDKVINRFVASGSRIIPMDAAMLGDYEKGNLQTQMAQRRFFRGTRRLYERSKLRRERLLRVLNILGFLPIQFREQIDFGLHPGQFMDDGQPLIAYRKNAYGKREFSFMSSFDEMLKDFSDRQPELVSDERKVPYDWTIYYLRKKALTEKISKEELAWVILNFNAKRGYYQRGDDEDKNDDSKLVEYKKLKVTDVIDEGEDKKKRGNHWYTVVFESGVELKRTSPFKPFEIGDEREMLVTTTLDRDGNIKKDKNGEIIKPKPKIFNSEEDWAFLKKKTEYDIEQSHKTVGTYIYENLLSMPSQKIRGRLVRVIERKFYKDELIAILKKQSEYHPELRDRQLYEKCVRELYHHNEAHVESISDKDFTSLFVEDIIFYHRPLKSCKHLIDNCPLESYNYVDKETGEIITVPIKCIPKSNPLYQEFRLWQFISNLRIYQKERMVDGKLKMDFDCTQELLNDAEDYVALFDWLNDKETIEQKDFLKYKGFGIKKQDIDNYRWNYVEDKKYPCNKTRFLINSRLKKGDIDVVLTNERLSHLWHILYSVNDVVELGKALRGFAKTNNIAEEQFYASFKTAPQFDREYGAYSEKAIKKLLALMRRGKYWSADAIDNKTRERINKIINGIEDESISERVRSNAIKLAGLESFAGLPEWLASYVIYGRHSEAKETKKFKTPDDIDYFLKHTFTQGNLRNPIVEHIISETLRVTRDIWRTYGKIDEIHIELGRDMKQTNEQRAKASQAINENENANLRVRALLQEFTNPEYKIDNVRPYSPVQQDKFRIYEDGVLTDADIPDDINEILKGFRETDASKRPSQNQVKRYILWLEQNYCSPYTGQPIPLSRLFSSDYEIEHVIPQSRYFDDSMSNKVICESEVNKAKDRMLGYEFIQDKGGSIIKGNFGKDIRILTVSEYEQFVNDHYSKNRKKMGKLLMGDIPDSFIERQMNDSRYIAKEIMSILSNVVRDDDELEGTSKHIVPLNGTITTRLKKEWGINDVWNDIVYPRFERLNRITGTHEYGEWRNVGGKNVFQTSVPLSISKGFQKKRIDHRHHAMDAMVIAATTKDHVNYLNNLSALSGNEKMRYDLQHKLCTKSHPDEQGNYVWQFNKPWENFTQDVRAQLEGIIISFKQNLRVINKMTNHYQHYVDGEKVIEKQTKGEGWAVRKSLHKAHVYAAVNIKKVRKVKLSEALKDWKMIKDSEVKQAIRELIKAYHGYDEKTMNKYFKDREYKLNGKDISKVDVYYFSDNREPLSAIRVPLDKSFDEEKIKIVTDSGIQKILLNHLHRYKDEKGKNQPDYAFSPEGIERMNKDIIELNGGKQHKPISKVRVTESFGSKFAIGDKANNKNKYVEADKGTILYYAIYVDADGNRSFESIPFVNVVERQKNGLSPAEEVKADGRKLLFTLSPNDLVYVPETSDVHVESSDIKDHSMIYKMVSSSEKDCFFVPQSIAAPIIQTIELGANNKAEKAWNGIAVKKVCYKLIVDRLGHITKVIQ
jgi:CRISPR-associated endonuclease Csn1